MFGVLLESSARPAERRGWFIGSGGLHAAMVTAAVVATMQLPAPDLDRVTPTQTLVFRVAPPTQPSAPQAPTVAVPAPGIPGRRFEFRMPDVPLSLTTPTQVSLDASTLLGTVIPGPGSPPVDAPGGTGTDLRPGGVYGAEQVERIVIANPRNGAPAYPPSLRAAGVEGEVLVRFVVDSTGRVEPRSIDIARAAHPAFGDAVRSWLIRNRYAPAEVGGRPVRQLVEQRINFALLPRS